MLGLIDLRLIEEEVEAVKNEADKLLARAREAHRAVQDIEVEVEGHGDPSRLYAAILAVRSDVASIARQLTRSQASLVHPSDPRYAAACKVVGWVDQADESARFPRAAA